MQSYEQRIESMARDLAALLLCAGFMLFLLFLMGGM